MLTDFGSGDDRAFGMVAQPDGKLVVTGSSSAGVDVDFALARYDPDGSLDTSFGDDGLVLTDFGGKDEALALLQTADDNKVVVAGTSSASGDDDFALARYLTTNEQPGPPRKCGGLRATILGTPGNDQLRGTNGRDVILGLDGDDEIRGLGDKDMLCGGGGSDMLIGGPGNDRLLGERGRDRLIGNIGTDRLDGGTGRDLCDRDSAPGEVLAQCERLRDTVRRPPIRPVFGPCNQPECLDR